MPKAPRVNVGDIVYHVLNRSNGRGPLFDTEGDYAAFLRILAEAHAKTPMRLVAYCVMPNHWHLVLWPFSDRDMSKFVHWLDNTHAHRWQVVRNMVGFGHVYQGRFKSFPIQDDRHYLTVCRYVERNPARAGLVARAEEWLWSSLYQRQHGLSADRPPLVDGPMKIPDNWVAIVNSGPTEREEEQIHHSIDRGRPFGDESWVDAVAHRLKLQSTLRPRGRPRTH